ncbi:MAG: tRNA-specific adenosine deaminase [Flavobacteriales bacterium]|nr:tRNA-specific adenosine deaminase [Flavobacteriales bacterium]|tara:strand:+ start:265 stop:720 length:456 start_codon:yes stop_codon:yes gene_type:complete
MINPDELYMQEALKEARKAFQENEVPVGCIIVYKKTIIAKGYNMCEKLCDPTAHAEMQVLTSACNYLQSKYLDTCTMYTTLEPCVMCAGALYWSKIGRIIYGAKDVKKGVSLFKKNILHPKTKIQGGVLMDECGYLLTSFFQKKRKLDKKK